MGGLELKNKGFSLVEVLIAMSILTIGILAVISMQTTSLKIQSRSKHSYNVQLVAQQIMERVRANAFDDAAILSYSGLNTKNAAPIDEPAKSDYDYFKSLTSKIPNGHVEISINNQRPYPVKLRVSWKDGAVSHYLDYDTFILPQ